MTVVLNVVAGQLVSWLHTLGVQAGINAAAILMNRGEFTLILATLAIGAGLDERLEPFAGLYVLIMAVLGPLLSANSERIGGVILRTKKSSRLKGRDPMLDEEIALVEAATAEPGSGSDVETRHAVDRVVEQAMQQPDTNGDRKQE
jgi:CPA2 family monovalent cation:H+ antiporter-2